MSTHNPISRFVVESPGKKTEWHGCHDMQINRSIHTYKDTAVIVMPNTALLRTANKLTPSSMTAEQFTVGDKITIELGWDGNPREEFHGFISRVNYATPCVIECEGQSWILRNKKKIVWSKTTTSVKAVLEEITRDTDIKLSKLIPDMPLKNIVINNASGTQVIDFLKGLFNGVLSVFFTDTGELYAGLSYTDVAQETVRYRLGWNTQPPNSLKYRDADEVEVSVEIKYRDDNGKMITTKTGTPGGTVRKETLTAVTDVTTIEKVAKAKLLQEAYNGYEGSINTLLLPNVGLGWRAEIEDPRYEQRGGVYFVDSLTTKYGMRYIGRTVGIGIEL